MSFQSVEGIIYYAFDFSVNNPGEIISGNDSEYFAMFKDDGNSYRAKIDIVPASSQGDFTVGISSTGNSADATWPYDLSFNTTYRATVKYDQSQNILGKLIISSTVDNNILNLNDLKSGIYIVKITQNNRSEIKKLIIK